MSAGFGLSLARMASAMAVRQATRPANQALVSEEFAAHWIRRNQRVHSVRDFLQPLQAASGELLDGGENHLARGTERRRSVRGFAQTGD